MPSCSCLLLLYYLIAINEVICFLWSEKVKLLLSMQLLAPVKQMKKKVRCAEINLKHFFVFTFRERGLERAESMALWDMRACREVSLPSVWEQPDSAPWVRVGWELRRAARQAQHREQEEQSLNSQTGKVEQVQWQ